MQYHASNDAFSRSFFFFFFFFFFFAGERERETRREEEKEREGGREAGGFGYRKTDGTTHGWDRIRGDENTHNVRVAEQLS